MTEIPRTDEVQPKQPGFLFLAAAVWIASLFGIRDVIITPVLRSVMETVGLESWLVPILWLLLVLSSAFLLWYLWAYRSSLKIGIPLQEIGFWILLASPFLFLLVRNRLFLDFWLDEMISIIRHILPSVKSAVLYYPVPNNHVFSNLLAGIYLQLFGWQDLRVILENPQILRIPYLITSMMAVFLMAGLAYHSLGKWSARVMVVLFSTTIPFLNFAGQVRGYAITFLFSSGLLFLIWSYYQDRQIWKAALVGVISALLIYTIPSNIYYLLGIILIQVFELVRRWVISSNDPSLSYSLKDIFNLPSLQLIFIILDGVFIGALFYLPVLDQVLGNPYVETRGLLQGTVFNNAFQNSIRYYVSGRNLVILISAGGLIFSWIRGVREKHQDQVRLIRLGIWAFLLPYLLSFVRGDHPFPRTFLVGLPAFLFSAALGIQGVFSEIEIRTAKPKLYNQIVFAVFLLLCYGPFFQSYASISAQIRTNLVEENIDYVEHNDTRMWASHFLESYRMLDVIEAFNSLNPDLPLLVLKGHTRYEWVVEKYLDGFGISHEMVQDPDQFTPTPAYLIVSYPERAIKEIKELYPETSCTEVTERPLLYTLHRCDFLPREDLGSGD